MGRDNLVFFEIIQCSVVLVYFIKHFVQAKIRPSYYIYLAIALSIIVISGFSKYRYFIDLAVYIVVYFVLPLLMVNGMPNKSKIYLSLLIVGSVSFINSCVAFFTSFINLSGFVNDVVGFGIRALAMILLLGLINIQKIKALIIDMMNVSRNIKVVLLFFVWELVFLNALQNLIFSRNLGIKINLTIGTAIFITAVVSCIVIHLLISNNLRSAYYKKINATMEEKVLQQVRHYQQMSKANENLRKFRHDFNNMLIGLNSCLKDGNLEKARAYLSRLAELAEKDNIKIHSGDSLVDSLIADKVSGAGDHNIEFEFEGLIPVDVMDPVDLCIVFGNALDNAAEACIKLPVEEKKVISISAKQRADMFFIKITNPVGEEVRIKNNTVVTTKDDAFSHGIGLYSMRKVTEKYNGSLILTCENGLFTADMGFIVR